MAANDMHSTGFNADEARYNRLNRTVTPEYAPGQAPGIQEEDVFATSPFNNTTTSDPFSSGSGVNGQMMDVFNSGVGGISSLNQTNIYGANPVQNMQMTQQQPQVVRSTEEEMWDFGKLVLKHIWDFFCDVFGSFKEDTPQFWSHYGFRVAVVGLVLFVLGIIMKIFKVSVGTEIAIGGLFTIIPGICFLMLFTKASRLCTSRYKVDNNTFQDFSQSMDSLNDSNSTPSMNPAGQGFPSSSSNNWFEDSSFGDDFSDTGEDCYDDTDDDIYGLESEDIDAFSDTSFEATPIAGMTTKDALASNTEITNGMVTRQWLFEAFNKRLSNLQPDYYKLNIIDDTQDIFYEWDERLIEAAKAAGAKEDNYPSLEKLEENLFTIIVTCTRPQGLKMDVVALELSNIYAYQVGCTDSSVFATCATVGLMCIITIFNGRKTKITLKDMMAESKGYILDTKNIMPVLLGVTQKGEVVKTDFAKLESLVVSGMPRTGKSWFVQLILAQLVAYMKPSELNIYICDPKDGISDYKDFCLPHVKKFAVTHEAVIATLRNLVKIEAPRRKKIIGDAGFVNIWDFKKRYPDVKLPIIYVVIDEIVSLATDMDKDTNAEFRMLLRVLISQLPALGIRAILIPHILNNDIIEKKTSDLIPFRCSVCGDADHIEKATGAKPKDFPYRLVEKGDIGIRLRDGVYRDVMYIKAPILSESNEENKNIFDYMMRVWKTIEPEEYENSVAPAAEEDKLNEDLLASSLGDNNIGLDENMFIENSKNSGSNSAFSDVYDLF